MNTVEMIEKLGILPVIVIDDADKAVDLADALLAGGVYAAEVTMRTAAGKEAIARMSKERPDMLVGAGTVLTAQAAEEAIDAGAKFVVSPGLSPEVLEVCNRRAIPYIPGVITPTEIATAMSMGLTYLKFFPASSFGGASTIKALAAPYTMIKFMPTGGVTVDNMADYLKLSCIYACGASFISERKLIDSCDWAEITKRCAAAVAKIKEIRG